MRFATRKEIEYLGSLGGRGGGDARLIRELSRQLDALRCYDQCISAADWRPRAVPDRQPPGGQADFRQ